MSESFIFPYFLFFGERDERFAHDRSFPLSNVSKSLRSLTKNEGCERITQVAHQKLANEQMSKLLIHSFLGKKRAIRSENR